MDSLHFDGGNTWGVVLTMPTPFARRTAHGVLAGELQRVQCTFVESYETTFSGFGALAGFFLISASATAASRVAESLTRALRRTLGECHAVAAQEGGDNQVCAY